MKPLLLTGVLDLTADQTATLATWAAKTAIMSEYAPGAFVTSRQASRTWLMENQEPPPRTQVWAAIFAPSDEAEANLWQHRWADYRAALVDVSQMVNRPEFANTQMIGISAGRLLLIVSQTESLTFPHLVLPPEWSVRAHIIWPRRDTPLRPALSLPMTRQDFLNFRASLVDFLGRTSN
jgi:hypothetical protein